MRKRDCSEFGVPYLGIVALLVICAMSVGRTADDPILDKYRYEGRLWQADIASLHDVRGIWFHMFQPQVAGLDTTFLTNVRRSARYSLVGAGVDLCEKLRKNGSEPMLLIKFHILEDSRIGLVYFCEIEFSRVVTLSDGCRMMAETWESGRLGFASLSRSRADEAIADAVDDCVGDFVTDYLFANQEGYQEKHDSIVRKYQQLEERNRDTTGR